MQDLLDKTNDFHDDVFRNIVSLKKSEDLFSDLTGNDNKLSRIAASAEMRVKQAMSSDLINRGFYYSAAIDYPFSTDQWMQSRYSDGSFPIWYGSLERKTTVYETAFHMLRAELAVQDSNEIITRERAIYRINCKALLIDVRHKRKYHSQLISEDYSFTQNLGKRLMQEGHPGLLTPSARYQPGSNIVIFNPIVLHHPKLDSYLEYKLNPLEKSVRVLKPSGVTWLKINFE